MVGQKVMILVCGLFVSQCVRHGIHVRLDMSEECLVAITEIIVLKRLVSDRGELVHRATAIAEIENITALAAIS